MKNLLNDETIKRLKEAADSQENIPENKSEKGSDSFRKKIEGAIAAINKRLALDQTVEDNLSTGLDIPDFRAASKKIDEKRDKFVMDTKSDLKIEGEVISTEVVPDFTLDDKHREALETEMADPFNKFVYSKLGKMNKVLLLDHLVDNPLNKEKSEIIENSFITEGNYNVVAFSDNGFLMQLTNKEEVKTGDSFDIKNEQAQYSIITPYGTVLFDKRKYRDAFNDLKNLSDVHQRGLRGIFLQQEAGNKTSKESLTEDKINHEGIKDTEEKIEELIKQMEQRDLEVAEGEKKEKLPFKKFIKELDEKDEPANLEEAPVITSSVEEKDVEHKMDELIKKTETDDDRISKEKKEEIEKELTANEEEAKNNESTPVKNEEETKNNELKSEEFVNAETSASLNSNVSDYAESIGINPEELTANQEFLSLSPEQQQFALETLRRTSLAKSKVEGHKAFIAEMSSKNLFQKIPYLINQKYHKERHKIEAAKNIGSHGLEGYGEIELAWLVDVIKNGPEVKMNESGEVIVNCLHGEGFSDEQKELIADYNEGAREYIEEPGKGDGRKAWLHDLKERIFSTATNDNDQGKLIHAFFEAEKNIQLLKFLSANKETEKALDKIAGRSLNGSDRRKALWDAHKDKAGYAALGFTLRTGSKFALANTAALAGAVGFVAAPAAAFLVGAYRSGNMAIETIKENKELADLGIQDKSETAKALNIVSGTKMDSKGNEIFFGLKDKLDNLTNKLEELRMAGEFKKAQEFEEALRVRIVYTEGKMVNDGVDFGQGIDRGMNYLDLADSLVKANMAILSSDDYLRFKSRRYYNNVSETTKKLTRKRNLNERNLARLRGLSVEDRLRSFLNYKQERQIKKEEIFLIKEMAKGAALGASFAIVGSVIAEHLGIGDWLSKHNPLKAAGKGIESLKNIFSKDDVASAASSGTNTAETVTNITTSGGATEEVVSVETAAPEIEQAVNAETATPKVEKFVDTISNEGLNGKTDSVWRSVKEIFKANSEDLGYKGDPSNQQALDTWAETQTAKAVSHSGNLTDKVFSGNKIELIKDGDHFKIAVEQGSGSKPAFLNSEVSHSVGPEAIKEIPNNYNLNDALSESSQAFHTIDSSDLRAPVNPDSIININEVAKELHLDSETLSQQGDTFIYQGSGKSRIIFETGSKVIKEAFDASGQKIPDSFSNELIGKSKVTSFIKHGGLDKIFSNWNKLGSDDKLIYNNLDWFNKKSLGSEDLLKQIKGLYEVKMDGVTISNKHFVFSDGRRFDMTLKGVKNLVKFLARN